MTIRNQYDVSVDFDAAVNMMDDVLREQLSAEGIENEQDFFNAYAAAHETKFGEPWDIDKSNPVY